MLILVAGLVSYTDLRAELTFSNRTIAANLGFLHQNQSVDPDFSNIRTEYGMGYRWLTE